MCDGYNDPISQIERRGFSMNGGWRDQKDSLRAVGPMSRRQGSSGKL
jgi:hypothetical protein